MTAELARLTDVLSLRDLAGRYLAGLDEGGFDETWARSLFTEDVEMTFPVGSHRGLAGVAGFTTEIMARWGRTHHHGSETQVDVDGDLAELSWSLIASHVHHGSPLPPDPTQYFQLGGRFTGTARRTPDGWRFDRLRLRIVWTTGAVPRGVTQVDRQTLDTRGNTPASAPTSAAASAAASAATSAATSAEENAPMPTTLTADQQKELIEKVFHEGLDLGDLSAADRYLTADFRNHGSHDDSMRGPEAFKHTIRIQQSAFSDIKYEILDFIAMGDKAAIRWVMHGRHTGPFIGIQPTGLQVQHQAIIWFRFEGDRIAERWGIVDNFALQKFLQSGGKPVGPLTPAGKPAA
ncbi:ester cyclase [Streptomyces sp. NPDC058464]|uniref:ester cyclase n=1 Tax=Streptomyces sp. NPDC058464 TaxID=3346511 RepID=UPI003653A3D5